MHPGRAAHHGRRVRHGFLAGKAPLCATACAFFWLAFFNVFLRNQVPLFMAISIAVPKKLSLCNPTPRHSQERSDSEAELCEVAKRWPDLVNNLAPSIEILGDAGFSAGRALRALLLTE